MNSQVAINSLQEARRDALVAYYIAHSISDVAIEEGVKLSERVETPDDLFEYLLIDTKICSQVTTSLVAEATYSVQMYINRCLNGYDPEVDNDSGSTMVTESQPGGFLYDWDNYNQVFSTWAGKERLQYYPETYLDPTLRYSKTETFKALEETLNQGRISAQRVEKGFEQYLLSFETLANLQVISGYQAGNQISVNSADTLYFIGRTENSPHDYYWRSCNLAARNDDGQLVGDAWSQWLKITAPANEAWDGKVRACWYKDRLHACWISRSESDYGDGQLTYAFKANIWYLQSNGTWVSSRQEELTSEPNDFALIHNVEQQELNLYLDYAGTWENVNTVLYDSMSISTTPARRPVFYIDNGELVLDKGEPNTHNTETQAAIVKIAYLETDSALPLMSRLLTQGIGGLLAYDIQTRNIECDNTQPIDFNGAYGLYFWEIFFHASFLIANRFLNEQNYAESARWYQYIFAPTGFRNADGELDRVDGDIRYWNVVPLQQDLSWNDSLVETVDPDVIAMNDPMHYKLAIFLNSVNRLIEQGDSAYRQLQRDYLAQAKMCYLQASQMLGPRPVIDYTNSWPNPTVGDEAAAIDPSSGMPDSVSSLLARQVQSYLAESNGHFLPPYNAELLVYWDKLEVRLYNLRHNLSLDGQPLSLPLYAEPVSPSDLQRRHGTGNDAGGSSVSYNALASQFRFVVLLDKARTAVSNVIQFGSSLQNTLARRDDENMTLLMQSQQQQILGLTQDMQSNNVTALQEGLQALQESLHGAQTRLSHFNNLYNNWISGSEQTAMDLRVLAGALNTAAMISNVVGAAVEMAPNTFGLACGGSRWGGAARAVAFGLQAASTGLETSAQRLDISEQYRRRREEWQLQRDMATSEVASLGEQIESQRQQITMAQKQRAITQQELANQQAVYSLQSTRFTGLELYNWMSGRLSSLYYQLYDTTLSLCLATKNALAREIGAQRAGNLFSTPMWNDLYQGLLAGEGLMLELQKLENTYLKDDVRGLEVQASVSLNAQVTSADSGNTFGKMLSAVLNEEEPVGAVGGVNMAMVNSSMLTVTLDLAALSLNTDYGSTGKTGRLKNISVTLPALLGPYQDVKATLGLGATYVALSRGLDDSGLFVVDFNDPKYLPFEGEATDRGVLTLTFFKADASGNQRALVESLVDVIYHIQYTLKDY
ncbi:neuraminidase-like domain-containing protein [Pseudomonas moorei]|uniref:Tc toxin subunit A-related protein n=1 Tax=Pseudomonas moorei TaxID=395599 RepID=UPI00200D23B0|nr:neuraminidase-like domain-containing protein [Pseudomonas moorei]